MACCPYEYAKDVTIRDKWRAYRDKFSQEWTKYFGIAGWDCTNQFWNCHGNERHGAREGTPDNTETEHDKRNLARAQMMSRGTDYQEMDDWALTESGSTFNSLEDHMFAREEAIRQNVAYIAERIGKIRGEFLKSGFHKGLCRIRIEANFDRPIGTAMTQKCDGMKVHCVKAVFRLVYDPRDNVLYEITGYPDFEESDYDKAVPAAHAGRVEFIH